MINNSLSLNIYRNFQKILNLKIISSKKYIDVKLNEVPLRVFNPCNSDKIILYIHGGGWISGNLDTHTNICYKIAKETKRKVISIGYRLAPEFPFPAGLNDCYNVVLEMAKTVNLKDVVLMGDSAGANLVMATSLKGLHHKKFRVGKIIMFYPATQTDYTKNSIYKSLINNNKGFLKRPMINDFINLYLKDEKYKTSQYVNLMNAKRLFGLPKTLIITCGNDPLHDEGVAFVKKLKRHFVSVKHYDFKNAYHGYLTNLTFQKYGDKTIELIRKFMGD